MQISRLSLEKRSLTVELYDTGTLKSINTSAADQSGTVITNVVKTIASFAGVPCLFGCAPSIVEPPPLICNMETMLALYQVKALDEAISSYKDYLIEADPDDLAAGQAETLKTTVDYLIAQKASLVEKDLTIKVSKPIDLVEGAADIPIRFTLSDLGKWLSEEGDRAVIEENSEPEDLNEDGDLKRRLSQCLPHELKDNVFQSVLQAVPTLIQVRHRLHLVKVRRRFSQCPTAFYPVLLLCLKTGRVAVFAGCR